MAIYLDRRELPEDINDIPSNVLQFILEEHRQQLPRLNKLHTAYMAKNYPHISEDELPIVCDYPRYTVDTLCGMYLGDPVKYNKVESNGITSSVKATVRDGEVVRVDAVRIDTDITPITDAYKEQSISDIDMEIGKDIGEYGEAYELEYASDDEEPIPKTTVCSPRCSVMVRDTTVDHHKLFFMTYERRKRTDRTEYYAVFVYTDKECIEYYSDTTETPLNFHEVGRMEHFFGEVPAVEYRNNSDRLGDFETAMTIIDGYNTLQTNRLTDKIQFVDSMIVAHFNLDEETMKNLRKYKVLSNVPPKGEGGDIEYLSKQFNEQSVQVYADNLVKEIHKQTMTVDMTDASFGTASGEALKMKLLTMTMIVKNKIRSMERGLKKRFELYNQWLSVKGVMPIIDKDDVDVIFNISLPINESQIVDIVTKLKSSNLVDDEQLLSLLWFVKDPQATIEKVKAQKQEERAEYFDTFGFQAKENGINGEDSAESRKSSNESDTENK